MKKVIVCCPGGLVTGGAELLHQFVSALNDRGVDASMLYTPFETAFDVPAAYKHYNVPTTLYSNVVNDRQVVVVPETDTGLIKYFTSSNFVVWWLSVDNFYFYKGDSCLKDKSRDLYRLITGKRPSIKSLKKCSHYVQSEYAKEHLAKYNIESKFLSDYLNDEHTANHQLIACSDRKNIIAYNPKKGIKTTKKLMEMLPEIEFVPIINMTPVQVKKLLSESKIYIDFGHHPGKDRFPREAAMAGCCIITGKRGSAGNEFDVRIPSRYKIDETVGELTCSFRVLVKDIFDNYEKSTSDFNVYREMIKSEKSLFNSQVENFISNELSVDSVRKL